MLFSLSVINLGFIQLEFRATKMLSIKLNECIVHKMGCSEMHEMLITKYCSVEYSVDALLVSLQAPKGSPIMHLPDRHFFWSDRNCCKCKWHEDVLHDALYSFISPLILCYDSVVFHILTCSLMIIIIIQWHELNIHSVNTYVEIRNYKTRDSVRHWE